MLEQLAGKTHTVVSGLCLLTPGWEVVEHESTRVTFRELTPRELARHLAHGEWEGRAGGYAIQGRGAALVERIEGDYLNVVGLPARCSSAARRALPRRLRLRVAPADERVRGASGAVPGTVPGVGARERGLGRTRAGLAATFAGGVRGPTRVVVREDARDGRGVAAR